MDKKYMTIELTDAELDAVAAGQILLVLRIMILHQRSAN